MWLVQFRRCGTGLSLKQSQRITNIYFIVFVIVVKVVKNTAPRLREGVWLRREGQTESWGIGVLRVLGVIGIVAPSRAVPVDLFV